MRDIGESGRRDVRWSVVQAQPSSEHRAIRHLERQGFTCYAPREKVVRIVRGRKVHEARWLFPRYVFVWIEHQWHAILSTFGVSNMIMNGEHPAFLPKGWVNAMREQEHSDGLIHLKKSRFKRGQGVQVVGGLLDGQRGIYQGQTSRQREIVLLDALGRVELAPGLLQTA